jgi:hypothetical protein
MLPVIVSLTASLLLGACCALPCFGQRFLRAASLPVAAS